MKKLYIILFIILNTIMNGSAQELTGQLKDSISEEPIADVLIKIDDTEIHTHTDAQGKFVIQNLNEATYDVSFSKFGYESFTRTVTIIKDQSTIIDTRMIVKSISLPTVSVAAERSVSAASSKHLSAIDFENRPKNSAQDMLRLVPGLFIAQHAGGGKAEQIFIRGFDCDHGTDVASYVDGIPVNMVSHGHGQGYMDLHFLIPETVGEMDVFKGPYSPKYGNFATGAAVSFSTKDTLENNLIKLEQTFIPEIGNVSVPRVLAMFKAPFNSENVKTYLAADVLNNRGYFDAPQDFTRVNLFSKTIFQLNDHSSLKLSLSTFSSSWNASGQIPDREVLAGRLSRFGSIDDSEGGNTSRTNFNLSYVQRTSNGEFETQMYSFKYRFRLFSNFTFYLEDPINGDEIEQDDNRSVQGLNTRYSFFHKLGNMNNKLTVGLSYRADDIQNDLWHTIDRTRLESKALANVLENNSAVYLNETFRFSDYFRIETGVRYDYFVFDVADQLPTDSLHTNYSGTNYQSGINPKLNFIFTPNDKLQIFINSGRGFHSNDARSVVQDKLNHTLPVADAAEIGTVMTLSKRLVLSAAFWWMDMSNELVYVGDDGTTESKGPSRRSGIDISARYQLSKNLLADADLNISRGRFIEKQFGKELSQDFYIPLAPTLTSSGGLTYTGKFFESSVRYRHIFDRPANEDNSIIAKGYTLLDLSCAYKYKKAKFSLSVENLLNAEWNEAQFATESRLKNETESVEELHYTPGSPLAIKLGVIVLL